MSEHFGKRIEELLAETGEKPADLAKAVGVSKSAISFWISGDTKSLKGKSLTNVSEHYGVNPVWLAFGEGEKHPNGHKFRKALKETDTLTYSIPTSTPETSGELIDRYSYLRKMIWQANRLLEDIKPDIHTSIIVDILIPLLEKNNYMIREVDGGHYFFGTVIAVARAFDDESTLEADNKIARFLSVLTDKARSLGHDDFDVFNFSAEPFFLDRSDAVFAFLIDDKVDSGEDAVRIAIINKEWLKSEEDDTGTQVEYTKKNLNAGVCNEIMKYPDGRFILNGRVNITDRVTTFNLDEFFSPTDK